jgi:hypothetical protein
MSMVFKCYICHALTNYIFPLFFFVRAYLVKKYFSCGMRCSCYGRIVIYCHYFDNERRKKNIYYKNECLACACYSYEISFFATFSGDQIFNLWDKRTTNDVISTKEYKKYGFTISNHLVTPSPIANYMEKQKIVTTR